MSITPDILNDACDSLTLWSDLIPQSQPSYFEIENGYHIGAGAITIFGFTHRLSDTAVV
jgi:hypothetical protein